MKIISFTILFLLFYLGSVFAQSHTVFVLDTSKSVLRSAYLETMKENIKNITRFMSEENEITLFTFDQEVNLILTKKNITQSNIYEKIDAILAEGSWTYSELMLKEVVAFLQNEYGKPVNLFIFSDGINDPPPGESTNFGTYTNTNSSISYFYYTEQNEQKDLILRAFPNAKIQKLTGILETDSAIITTNLNQLIPTVQIEFQEGIRGQLATGVDLNLSINITANKAASGKEALLNIIPSTNIFNQAPEPQTRFIIQEGLNNFRFPYKIKNIFQGKEAKINFILNLAETPENFSKWNIDIKIAPLPFLEKLYKLPLYVIPTLFLLLIFLYILYIFLRYQFFVPVIKMSYQLTSKQHKKDIEPIVSSIDMGLLKEQTYTISSNPDAFLVLPEISKYTELILIKKGKKFKTRLLIHSRTIRNITTLDGRRMKKKKIKNGTTFQLDKYIFSFKTNLK